MSNADILYEFIETTNFQFPINKNPYYDELKNWLSNYNSTIKNALFIDKKTKTKIVNFGNGLLYAFELNSKESYSHALRYFCDLINKYKYIFPFSYLGQREIYMCLNESYYRINTPFVFTYENMLHKPLKNSNPNRFKSSDYAISYLSTSKELCWYECGRPNEYYIAKYEVKRFDKEKQKLLRLDINPVSAHIEIRRLICDHEDFRPYIEKYLMIFPLVAACSFVAVSKEKSEYLIPNMLMDWVGKSEDYLGIRYFSDSEDIMAKSKGEHNIALIAKNPKRNGISKDLSDIFGADTGGKIEHIISHEVKTCPDK